MDDQPVKKPGSLRDRIAAFEKPAASSSTPSGAPPPPRPKPGNLTGQWKPKAPEPPSPNEATTEAKKAGMSASDAVASISKGGGLKERMAALQGAFAQPATHGPPLPSQEGKPRVWKKVADIPPPPISAPQTYQHQEHPTNEEGEQEHKEEGNDGEPKELDEEEQERERRAAIAARMAKLGGARVGMGPPIFGKPSIPPKPKALSQDDSKEEARSSPIAVLPVSSKPTETEEPTDYAGGSQAEPSTSEVSTSRKTTEDSNEQERKPSLSLSPPEKPHQGPHSPSAMPLPAMPRRAAPPRRKTPAPPPVPVEQEEPVAKDPVAVPLPVSVPETPDEGSENKPTLAPTDTTLTEEHKVETLVPDDDKTETAKSVADENDEGALSEATPPPASPSERSLAIEDDDDSTEDEKDRNKDLKVHIDPTQSSTDTRGGDFEAKTPVPRDSAPEPAEGEDEEDEAARRKRIAAKLAEMGGVNPFALGGFKPYSPKPPASEEHTPSEDDTVHIPRPVEDQQSMVPTSEVDVPEKTQILEGLHTPGKERFDQEGQEGKAHVYYFTPPRSTQPEPEPDSPSAYKETPISPLESAKEQKDDQITADVGNEKDTEKTEKKHKDGSGGITGGESEEGVSHYDEKHHEAALQKPNLEHDYNRNVEKKNHNHDNTVGDANEEEEDEDLEVDYPQLSFSAPNSPTTLSPVADRSFSALGSPPPLPPKSLSVDHLEEGLVPTQRVEPLETVEQDLSTESPSAEIRPLDPPEESTKPINKSESQSQSEEEPESEMPPPRRTRPIPGVPQVDVTSTSAPTQDPDTLRSPTSADGSPISPVDHYQQQQDVAGRPQIQSLNDALNVALARRAPPAPPSPAVDRDNDAESVSTVDSSPAASPVVARPTPPATPPPVPSNKRAPPPIPTGNNSRPISQSPSPRGLMSPMQVTTPNPSATLAGFGIVNARPSSPPPRSPPPIPIGSKPTTPRPSSPYGRPPVPQPIRRATVDSIGEKNRSPSPSRDMFVGKESSRIASSIPAPKRRATTQDKEIMSDGEGDPIDPTFVGEHSPEKVSVTLPAPPGAEKPSQPQADEEEDDPEISRKRTIVERMARLGGVKFGMPMPMGMPPRPPPIRRGSTPKPLDPDGDEETNREAENRPTTPGVPEEVIPDDEDETARRRRIAARMVAMGGRGFGGFGAPPPPPPPTAPKPKLASSLPPPPTDERNIQEEPEPEQHTLATPPVPPRIPSTKRAPPPVPATITHTPPPPPPPTTSPPPVPSTKFVEDVESDAEAVVDYTDDDGEKIEAEDEEPEIVDTPPPLPPSRHGRPPVPKSPLPVPTPQRRDSVDQPGTTVPPPLPPSRRASTKPPVRTAPRPPSPSEFIMISDSTGIPPPAPPPPPPPPMATTSRSGLLPPVQSHDSSLQYSIQSIGSRSDVGTDLNSSWTDVEQEAPTASTSNVNALEGEPFKGPAPTALPHDALVHLAKRLNSQVLNSAAQIQGASKSHVIGDGSSTAFLSAVLSSIPTASLTSLGHQIYVQSGTNVQRRLGDILPGDIMAFHEARFKGHKGLASYSVVAGSTEEPLLGVVTEFKSEGKKIKVKVWAVNQHPNAYPAIDSQSYRLEDLKSGTVKVYRIAEKE